MKPQGSISLEVEGQSLRLIQLLTRLASRDRPVTYEDTIWCQHITISSFDDNLISSARPAGGRIAAPQSHLKLVFAWKHIHHLTGGHGVFAIDPADVSSRIESLLRAWQCMGIESTLIEVNPFLADLIESKLANYQHVDLPSEAARVIRRAHQCKVDLAALRKRFSPKNAGAI